MGRSTSWSKSCDLVTCTPTNEEHMANKFPLVVGVQNHLRDLHTLDVGCCGVILVPSALPHSPAKAACRSDVEDELREYTGDAGKYSSRRRTTCSCARMRNELQLFILAVCNNRHVAGDTTQLPGQRTSTALHLQESGR